MTLSVSLHSFQYIRNVTDLATLVQSKERIVVACYSDWCPASSQAKPVFERVAILLAGRATFAKVRIDVSPDVASLLGVEAIPTFYAFYNGRLSSALRGAVAESILVDWLARTYGWTDLTPIA